MFLREFFLRASIIRCHSLRQYLLSEPEKIQQNRKLSSNNNFDSLLFIVTLLCRPTVKI